MGTSRKQSRTEDRNFDDMADRFKRNIYGGLKGEIRLQVLRRDFAEFIPLFATAVNSGINKPLGDKKKLRILDAGGGQGQFALEMARLGHSVVLCDISTEMLKLAEAQIEEASLQTPGLAERITLVQSSIQALDKQTDQPFDLVACHAVLEWVVEPQLLLYQLLEHLVPGGYLSLTFYNLNSLIYKNLLRTNFKKIRAGDYHGYRRSLTPTNPLNPDDVYRWLAELPLEVLCRSGIRVFHDYIFDKEGRTRDPEGISEMELAFSRQEPYRSLGRYIHVLAQHLAQ